jgi:hypothetical protein
MRQNFHLASIALALCALSACGGSDSDPPPGPGLQSMRIVDKGTTVFSTTTVADYAPGRLGYDAGSFNGVPVRFTATLSTEDFGRLAALVESTNLVNTLGAPNAINAACRHNGYEISLVRNNVSYAFTIPGSQTCGAAILPVLSRLLELHGQLLIKYTPPPG